MTTSWRPSSLGARTSLFWSVFLCLFLFFFVVVVDFCCGSGGSLVASLLSCWFLCGKVRSWDEGWGGMEVKWIGWYAAN